LETNFSQSSSLQEVRGRRSSCERTSVPPSWQNLHNFLTIDGETSKVKSCIDLKDRLTMRFLGPHDVVRKFVCNGRLVVDAHAFFVNRSANIWWSVKGDVEDPGVTLAEFERLINIEFFPFTSSTWSTKPRRSKGDLHFAPSKRSTSGAASRTSSIWPSACLSRPSRALLRSHLLARPFLGSKHHSQHFRLQAAK